MRLLRWIWLVLALAFCAWMTSRDWNIAWDTRALSTGKPPE